MKFTDDQKRALLTKAGRAIDGPMYHGDPWPRAEDPYEATARTIRRWAGPRRAELGERLIAEGADIESARRALKADIDSCLGRKVDHADLRMANLSDADVVALLGATGSDVVPIRSAPTGHLPISDETLIEAFRAAFGDRGSDARGGMVVATGLEQAAPVPSEAETLARIRGY